MMLETELTHIDTQEPTAEYSVNDLVKYQKFFSSQSFTLFRLQGAAL